MGKRGVLPHSTVYSFCPFIFFRSLIGIFNNADLLEICERPGTATSALGFIDDVNILAYGTSTKENVKTLERVHKQCEMWARRHGSTFAPKKYELIHLARNPRKFDMTAAITIGGDKIS